MEHRLHATTSMAETFYTLFVNRRAYTLQSFKPHSETGRHYYYRPKARDGGPPPALSLDTLRLHLAGEITIGIYAINWRTQRSKWVAIDADYKNALEDLLRLQFELTQDGRRVRAREIEPRRAPLDLLREAGARQRLPDLRVPYGAQARCSHQRCGPPGRNRDFSSPG